MDTRQEVSTMLVDRVETFLMVVEAGSFSRAARRLGMTVSAVGKHVKSLEAEVGFPLFRKVGGRPVPTPAAEGLAGDLDRASASLSRAVARGKERANVARRTLVIAAPPIFACEFLLPTLASLEADPETLGMLPPIDLRSGNAIEDLSLGRIDLAFRFATRIPDGPYVSHFVGEDTKVFYSAVGTSASRQILVAGEGDLQTPLALADGGELVRSGQWAFNGMDTVLAAVVAGLGTGLLPIYFGRRRVAEGRIIRVHEPHRVEGRGLFAFVHEEAAKSLIVRELLRRIRGAWSERQAI